MTIGRSPDADVVIPDERTSRIHCGLRLWDGEYTLRDLKSMNGTFVNGRRIEVAPLKPGDIIRIGSTTIAVESDDEPGPSTAMQHIEDEMSKGKGYHTIMEQLVGKPPKAPEAPAEPLVEMVPESQAPMAGPVAEVVSEQPSARGTHLDNPMLAMPSDAGDIGVEMGPAGDSRPPPTPTTEAGKKKLRIVVKKKFGG